MQTQLDAHLMERPFRFYKSTTSTMQDLREWLATTPDLPSGAVVIADEQQAGKGRLGRTWLTPPQTAIAMSLLIRDFAPEHVPILGAVAVVCALEAHISHPLSLKWPNDVEVVGRKVCGVLSEALWEGNELTACLLGIGINVSVDFAGTELEYRAASLNDFAPQPIDRPALIADILAQINHWQARVADHAATAYAAMTPSPLHVEWKSRLGNLGQQVVLYQGEHRYMGKAVDVDTDGALILQTPDGEQHRFLAGDVSLSPR